MDGQILILGCRGQLGSAFSALLGDRAIAFNLEQVDFLDKHFINALEKAVQVKAIAAVINAAAYTQVDRAELEGRNDAMRINAEAVGELAVWCKQHHLPLVHFSTDYVFDGHGQRPFSETSPTAPLNAYGLSKLAGENAISASGCDYLIFRTSWLYDAWGKNFFNTMFRLFAEKESVQVVNDQVGAPTYAPHLARAVWQAMEVASRTQSYPSGIYHLCHNGQTSWHGFAQAILALARSVDSRQKSAIRCNAITPITSVQYPVPAKRPHNSRLDCTKAFQTFAVTMPSWQEGLNMCFEEKYGSQGLQDRRAKDHPA